MRRPALLTAVVAGLAVAFRRRGKARRAEADLWTEAGAPHSSTHTPANTPTRTAPDLR